MLEVGTVCRSREPILKTEEGDSGRLCRVVAVLPPNRWRAPNTPEYKVELLSKPVVAFCRERDLIPAPGTPTL